MRSSSVLLLILYLGSGCASSPSGSESHGDGNFADGPGCLPRGEVIELRGELVVQPFGKGLDGAVLLTADGERWILSYAARRVHRALDGKQVVARGRVCDKQGQAIVEQHFDAKKLRAE